MWNRIKNLFSSWFKQFRPALEHFLVSELNAVKEVIFDLWKQQGRPVNLKSWQDIAFATLKERYSNIPDTHLVIILNMAYDALKNARKIS